MLRAFSVGDFPPFGQLEMDFPPVENKPSDLAEVHLLTGINGTGKTRILALLASAFGNSEPLKRRMKGVEVATRAYFNDAVGATDALGRQPAGGTLSKNGFQHEIGTPFHNWMINVPAFAYSGSAYITDSSISVMADVPKPERASCLSFQRLESQSPQLIQAIANVKVQAAMDMMDDASEKRDPGPALRLARALENVFTEITGHRLIFQISSYPKAALMVVWENQRMLVDALPEGLRSIIGWLAHSLVMMDALLQGKTSPLDAEAVFLLDEIEGFLHPAWQRKILPAFQRLFPKAQMFVATHSPFLISSLNHGWIHRLSLGPDGKVKAEPPQAASEGDSYVTVLEDVMGVKEWYDTETEALLQRFRSHRDAAYSGHEPALNEARHLARQIGSRSMELEYMMGRELNQMDRRLAKNSLPK